MAEISEYHREREAVHALITFKRKEKQYEENNSNAFSPVYVGMVDADGIPEAQNAADKFYGLERLCAVISANWREQMNM